jgi:hypothetical protein
MKIRSSFCLIRLSSGKSGVYETLFWFFLREGERRDISGQNEAIASLKSHNLMGYKEKLL